ncbi:MAG: PD-(D/E)XK nuclease family protein, partial [Planctomycetes bacterium]|nr:PD-(D/E)XK nuclease family protein [Planctomycetota bacterium]
RLGRSAELSGLHLSPSGLGKSLACSFQFFGASLLDLKDVAAAGFPELTALERGTLCHGVLEKLAPVLRAGLPPPAREKSLVERASALLDDCVREKYPWALAPQFGIDLAALRALLAGFVPRYLALLRALGAVPLQPELPLRDAKDERPRFPLPTRAGGPADVGVGGRIDQPLLLADGRSLIVDFKFGKVAERLSKQAAAHADAQAPLYAWFLRTDPRFPDPVGMLYLSLAQPEAVFRPTTLGADLVDLFDEHATVVAEPDLDAAERVIATRLADLFESLARADARVPPVDDEAWKVWNHAKANPCQYCDLGLLCRARRRQ